MEFNTIDFTYNSFQERSLDCAGYLTTRWRTNNEPIFTSNTGYKAWVTFGAIPENLFFFLQVLSCFLANFVYLGAKILKKEEKTS